jgi:hypothetical protein
VGSTAVTTATAKANGSTSSVSAVQAAPQKSIEQQEALMK